MTRRAAFLAAILVAIGRPTLWFMALATFLLRGGIVLVVLPIITLPSVLGLSNAFAPILLPLALGRFEPALLLGPAAVVVVLLAWLIIGGRLAAGIDVALARDAADAAIDEGVGGEGSLPPGGSVSAVGWRVVAIRLVAWLPLAIALGIGLARIVQVTYLELTRPVDVLTPLIVRVAAESTSQLGLIVVAWALGEVVGGVATRRAALTTTRYGNALGWAIRTSASSPLSWLVPWVGTTILVALVMAPTLAAASFAWTKAVDALSDRLFEPVATMLTMLAFVAIWLAAIVLSGVALAVRSTVQTFEHVRRHALETAARRGVGGATATDAAGTFGASAHRRPGDWSPGDEGGSL
ncbi:MAG TPA: hypothetical protein VFV72_00115 [Candidatus Limnocylindrales bacterium]|nr:hypothetical protein [Candidatus Limnocylindrales bacterium]